MKFSPLQEAIFAHIETNPGKSLVVQAVAGSGKTTTIVECARRLPKGSTAVFLAFNKSIATELAKRLPQTCESSTLNSIGYRMLRDYAKQHRVWPKVDDRKLSDLFSAISIGQAEHVKLARMAKVCGWLPDMVDPHLGMGIPASPIEDLAKIMEHYGIVSENHNLLNNVRVGMAENIRNLRVVDFADQIYLPVALGMRRSYDFVIVDEAQDLSQCDRAMVRRLLAAGGTLIAVGDRNQSIYGFKGADVDSMDRIVSEFDADELPLSVTYRCDRSIVDLANRYRPGTRARDDADVGLVRAAGAYGPESFNSRDLILSRKNAPTVALAFKLISCGVPCQVMGRDIGRSLRAFTSQVTRTKKDISIDSFVEKMFKWRDRNMARAVELGDEAKMQSIEDRVDTILAIRDSAENVETLFDLRAAIDDVFRNDDEREPVLTLSTVHKAKGLEADRVFILNPGDMPSPYASRDWERAQEINLQYVAVTRARHELVYIELDEFGKTQTEAA